MTLVDASTGEKVVTSLAVADVVIGERIRLDLGDLTSLKGSILAVGLLQPIVIDGEGVLVAGHRRLQAVRELGWAEVPVTVAASLTDAVDHLVAERDENTCRKEFTPSEAVAAGKRLEELVRPSAEARRADAGKANLPTSSGDSPELTGPAGQTRDAVGAALGMGGSRYEHAKRVVEATEDPDPHVSGVAKLAKEVMDATGKVEGAYKQVKAAKDEAKAKKAKPAMLPEARWAQIKRLAGEGFTSRQIAEKVGVTADTVRDGCRRRSIAVPADEVVGKVRVIDSNRVVGQLVLSLAADADSLRAVPIDFDALDPEKVDGWVSSLNESFKVLNRFRAQLKEKARD